jgi:hypothetical protein
VVPFQDIYRLFCNDVFPSHAPQRYIMRAFMYYAARDKTRPDPIGVIVVATISAKLSILPIRWLWEPVCNTIIRTTIFLWTIVCREDMFLS